MSMSHSATAGRPKGETAKAITSPCMPQRSPVNKANRAPIRQRKDRAQNTHEPQGNIIISALLIIAVEREGQNKGGR